MGGGLEFSKIGLVTTQPMYWAASEVPKHTANLLRFLEHVSSQAGTFYIRNNSPQQSGQWLAGSEAKLFIRDFGEKVEAGHSSDPFDVLDSKKFWCAFDFDCLRNAASSLNVDAEALDSLANLSKLVRGLPYIGFSVDFSQTGDILMFTPQLFILSYLPEEENFWPASTQRPSTKPTWTLEEAVQVVGAFRTIVRVVSAIRIHFDLGHARIGMENVQLLPPSFVFLSPTGDHEILVEKWQTQMDDPLLHGLLGTTLGVLDIDENRVSACTMEGAFLVFRVENISVEVATHDYLMLSLMNSRISGGPSIERRLLFSTDQLAFIDAASYVKVRSMIRAAAQIRHKMRGWAGTIDNIAAITSAWIQHIELDSGRERDMAFEAVEQMHDRLLRLANDLIRKTDNALRLPILAQTKIIESTEYTRRGLTVRRLPQCKFVLDAISNSLPFRVAKIEAEATAGVAETLRDTFESTSSAVDGILRKQERTSERRQTRATYRLTLAVGALTVATVLPSLVDVRITGPDAAVVRAVQIFIILAAIAGIAATLWPLLGYEKRRVSAKSRIQASMMAIIAMGAEADSASRTPLPRTSEEQARIAASDKRAVGECLKVLSRVESLRNELRQSSLADGRSILNLKTELCITNASLVSELPESVSLPTLAALIRYKYPNGQMVMSDQDVVFALRWFGIPPEKSTRVMKWCEENAELPAGDFAERFQDHLKVGA